MDLVKLAKMMREAETPTSRCDVTDLPPTYCACPKHRNIKTDEDSE